MFARLRGVLRGVEINSRYKRSRLGAKIQARRLRIDQLDERRVLDAGDLDPSFGGDGIVLTNFPLVDDQVANDVAMQPDGKIVIVGRQVGDFALARYNPDGSLDRTFDADGLAAYDFLIGGPDEAFGVAIQTDGKIIAAGRSGPDIVMARYTTDGVFDTSFGTGGIVVTEVVSGSTDAAFDVAIQTDGKIVLVGSSDGDFVVARYQTNGDLDLGFGVRGIVLTDVSSGSLDVANSVAIQTDGRIVAGGQAGNDFALVRYLTNGEVDDSFDDDGRVTTDFPGTSLDVIHGIALQSDGRIVAAGTTDDDIALACYDTDGGLDLTFDGDGLVVTDVPGVGSGNAVALQTDGRIVVAGRAGADFAILRYDASGTLDETFDDDGIVVTDLDGSSTDVANGVALQANGRIVAVGGSDGNIAVARYLGAPNGGDGASTDTIGLYSPSAATFFLRNVNSSGTADNSFLYGPGGLLAISGDWNGDLIDTIGLYDPASGVFFLRNSNTAGVGDITFQFGAGGQGYLPIAGDWNGDGIDTVGLYRQSSGIFFLRNSNTAGVADSSFQFGASNQGYLPLAGNWDGILGDTIGLYQPTNGVFFLNNIDAGGAAALTFQFGPGGINAEPLAGNWDGVLGDSIGIYVRSSGSVFLRNSNTAGTGDIAFFYGPTEQNWQPITGDWNGPELIAVAGPDSPDSKAQHRRPPNQAVLETVFTDDDDWLT